VRPSLAAVLLCCTVCCCAALPAAVLHCPLLRVPLWLLCRPRHAVVHICVWQQAHVPACWNTFATLFLGFPCRAPSASPPSTRRLRCSGAHAPNPVVLWGCLRIYAGEVVIDVIKHAVLGKFNEIRWGAGGWAAVCLVVVGFSACSVHWCDCPRRAVATSLACWLATAVTGRPAVWKAHAIVTCFPSFPPSGRACTASTCATCATECPPPSPTT